MYKDKQVFAIILAAGSSNRFRDKSKQGNTTAKQFDLLVGKPIISYSLDSFAKCDLVDFIIVALPQDMCDRKLFQQLVPPEKHKEAYTKLKRLVGGGKTRAESTLNALKAVKGPRDSYILVHDAARPLVAQQRIRECIKQLDNNDGAVLMLPATDSLFMIEKSRRESSSSQRRLKPLIRSNYISLQTPQAFSLGLLRDAFTNIKVNAEYTDEASLVLSYKPDASIFCIVSDNMNMKLTYPEDKIMLEALIKSK